MDIALVEKLALMLERSSVSELSVTSGTFSVTVKRPPEPVDLDVEDVEILADDEDVEAVTVEIADDNVSAVTAAMVGIFHTVDEIVPGVEVKAGQTIGLIESMKLMNEVKSNITGTIEELLIEDGSPVEYGQPLLSIRKAG